MATEEMVARLREACVDWDRSQMMGSEEPRVILDCGTLRAVASMLERESGDLRYAKQALDRETARALKFGARAKAAEAHVAQLETTLKPFAGDKMPSLRKTVLDYNEWGLRCMMSPMEIARLRARTALSQSPDRESGT